MIEFTKMHGLGNDYIYINMLEGKNVIEDIEEFTRKVSDRHFGIGSDGVILIKESDIADLKMQIFNADGSEAKMCGNGIRCFAKYAYEENIVKKEEFDIETLAGIRHVKLNIEEQKVKTVRVNMGKAEIGRFIKIKTDDWYIPGTEVNVGNPHFVIRTEDIDNIDINKYGPIVENHPLFPYRTNVEFIEIIDENTIKMRVWERGSGETFACGTGACASFAYCNDEDLVGKSATVLLKGGELNIELDEESNEIFMTGPATRICSGTIDKSWKKV